MLFTQQDSLRDRGVPVDDPEHERTLSLVKPLQAFTIEFANDGPPPDRVKIILQAIRTLLTRSVSGAGTQNPTGQKKAGMPASRAGRPLSVPAKSTT